MVYNKVHLIGCGVLRLDADALQKESGITLEYTWLEGGLHASPRELRRRLQLSIDEASNTDCDLIAVGYGLCGRGTVDIWARSVPLAIPRVHDCISLFLGSDAAYHREFSQSPGTYYISAGWYEEKVQPKEGAKHHEVREPSEDYNRDYDFLLKKYGEANADSITAFLNSWKKNYQRAVFIDTGAGKSEKYAEYAKAMAEEFAWQYQRLDGSMALLDRLVKGDASLDDILIVPPGYVTTYDSKIKKLTAVPETTQKNRKSSGTIHKKSGNGGSRTESRIGLGIDAGGTYTDAVVFDLKTRTVIAKAKAPTTKWNYTEGILEAIRSLETRWFEKIGLVSVSTTLATNAIVEGTGQETGLILMPPQGFSKEGFHEPAAVIDGRMDITGIELEPVQAQQVRDIALGMKNAHKVQAFAVSGYGGAVNPAHELAVKQYVEESTGCYVCCGHELSDLLDFRLRANTAVLNAGIVPLLERFLDSVTQSLTTLGVDAPIMVVKGDGSLMSDGYARLHPVQTILSGPAASIAGARYLTDFKNATVVDVGGTTSDIGKLTEGRVDICAKGAVVGKWRTHVSAVDMHTLGLGGDSEVYLEKRVLHVGPRRIAPMAWLGKRSNTDGIITYLSEHEDDYVLDSRLAQVFMLTGRTPDVALSDHERNVLSALSDGPLSVGQLVEKSGAGHPILLRIETLERQYVVQRCGLTPTDLLHVSGEVSLWDTETARRYVEVAARIIGLPVEELHSSIFTEVSEKLIFELVKRQLDLEFSGENLEDSPTGKALFDALLAGGNADFRLSAHLEHPVIGLGAAASYFLTDPAKRLTSELIIPQYAEVANAVGAITSKVHVSRRGSVIPSSDGTYILSGVEGGLRFIDFDEAHNKLMAILEGEVKVLAEAAGTEERDIQFSIDDRLSATAEGAEIFLERKVTADIIGAPTAQSVGVAAAE